MQPGGRPFPSAAEPDRPDGRHFQGGTAGKILYKDGNLLDETSAVEKRLKSQKI